MSFAVLVIFLFYVYLIEDYEQEKGISFTTNYLRIGQNNSEISGKCENKRRNIPTNAINLVKELQFAHELKW